MGRNASVVTLGGRFSGSLFCVTDDCYLGCFDWWSKLLHLQALRPSLNAGTANERASKCRPSRPTYRPYAPLTMRGLWSLWLRIGDVRGNDRLRNLAQSIAVAWVALKSRPSGPTYRPYAPLTMRGPWSLWLRIGDVRGNDRLRSLVQLVTVAWVASIGGASCSTYRPYASLVMWVLSAMGLR